MKVTLQIALLVMPFCLGSIGAQAQPFRSSAEPFSKAAPTSDAPAPLVILFEIGSANLSPKADSILDRASRAYNEGKPIVMILTGTTDKVGSARANLSLSQRRAVAVLNGLLVRGIPAERFQIVAKGETETAVATSTGVPEAQNRRVEITWR